MTFYEGQPFMKGNIWLKKFFDGSQPLMKDNHWRETTYGEILRLRSAIYHCCGNFSNMQGVPKITRLGIFIIFQEPRNWVHNPFLSSAYVPGPTSRKFCFSFFHSVFNFLGASLVKALSSGRGSGIPHFRTLSPAMQGLGWAVPHSDFLAWMSNATLKNFISGVSSRILMR